MWERLSNSLYNGNKMLFATCYFTQSLLCFYKPSFRSSLAIWSQLWQNKVGTFGAVGIKHIHAGLSCRHRLWTGPLPRGSFARLPRHFCVVVVRTGAHDAEVGARVLHPYAVTLLRVQGRFILARHPAVVEQVQRRWRDVQHGAALRRGHLVMRLCLLGHSAPSCYQFPAGPAVGATVTVSTFGRDDLWYSSATSAVLGLNIAALNRVTGMSDGAGGGGKSIAGAFHGHGIYSANNYTVNEQNPTKYRLAVPIKQQNLFIMVNFFLLFSVISICPLKCPSFHWIWFSCVSALLIFWQNFYKVWICVICVTLKMWLEYLNRFTIISRRCLCWAKS